MESIGRCSNSVEDRRPPSADQTSQCTYVQLGQRVFMDTQSRSSILGCWTLHVEEERELARSHPLWSHWRAHGRGRHAPWSAPEVANKTTKRATPGRYSSSYGSREYRFVAARFHCTYSRDLGIIRSISVPCPNPRASGCGRNGYGSTGSPNRDRTCSNTSKWTKGITRPAKPWSSVTRIRGGSTTGTISSRL